MCGKYHFRWQPYIRRRGSPPHVREIPCSFLCIICLVRITPACAGNTQKKYQMTLKVWDHSHMCGKYYVVRYGSNLTDRITPACAGNTMNQSKMVTQQQDHPRMCGKYSLMKSGQAAKAGSPPHVREILNSSCSSIGSGRITPACAGNTYEYICWLRHVWDHPRMCGKY